MQERPRLGTEQGAGHTDLDLEPRTRDSAHGASGWHARAPRGPETKPPCWTPGREACCPLRRRDPVDSWPQGHWSWARSFVLEPQVARGSRSRGHPGLRLGRSRPRARWWLGRTATSRCLALQREPSGGVTLWRVATTDPHSCSRRAGTAPPAAPPGHLAQPKPSCSQGRPRPTHLACQRWRQLCPGGHTGLFIPESGVERSQATLYQWGRQGGGCRLGQDWPLWDPFQEALAIDVSPRLSGRAAQRPVTH